MDIPVDGRDTMYFLDQREVFHERILFYCFFYFILFYTVFLVSLIDFLYTGVFQEGEGGQESAIVPNDIIPVLEVMLMEKNYDHTVSVLNNRTKDSMMLGNPSYWPRVYFGAFVINFNTISLLFEPPVNKHKIIGHKGLLSIDHRRMEIFHTGAWIKVVFVMR